VFNRFPASWEHEVGVDVIKFAAEEWCRIDRSLVMTEERTPPSVSAVGENVPVATGHELKVNPIEDRASSVRFLMFLGAWSSFKKGDGVFDAISPELGTAPFRIIREEDYGLELPLE
jgi:hypothetical protein